MKTTFSNYCGDQPLVKRPRLQTYEQPLDTSYELPIDLWEKIMIDVVLPSGQNASKQLTDLRAVCQEWKQIGERVQVNLVNRMWFDHLFLLPTFDTFDPSHSKIIFTTLCEQLFRVGFRKERYEHPMLNKNSFYFLENHGRLVRNLCLNDLITDFAWKQLLKHTSSSLKLIRVCNITRGQFKEISNCSKLCKLDMAGFDFHIDFEPLTKLQNLEKLKLDCGYKHNQLSLAALTNLKKLQINKCVEFQPLFPAFFPPNLVALAISGFSPSCNQIVGLTNLETLRLTSERDAITENRLACFLPSDEVQKIGQLVNLKTLSLNIRNSQDMKLLSTLTNLKYLNLNVNEQVHMLWLPGIQFKRPRSLVQTNLQTLVINGEVVTQNFKSLPYAPFIPTKHWD